MIHLVKEALQGFEVHLASASPRRRNILKNVGFECHITPSTFEENLEKSLFDRPEHYVMETAKHKAKDVISKLLEKDSKKSKFIIATDTVVVADGKILEKPANHEEAYRMLSGLNELKHHQVYSGVTLLKYENAQESRLHQFFECTNVVFGDIPDNIIRQYANTTEPLYGIQDVGGTLIEKIDGCYFNVQGFPLYRFCKEACKFLNNG